MKGTYKRRNCKCDPEKKCSCGGKTWTYWVDIGPDPKSGKRRQVSKGGYKTRKDAEAAVSALITVVNQGTFIKESDILFKDFAEQWLQMYIERFGPKPGTIRLRKYGINKLLTYFLHLKLKNVTEDIYQEALNDLHAKPLSKITMEGIHVTGKMLFDMAVRKKLIRENPTMNTFIKKAPIKVIKSHDENTDEKFTWNKTLPKYFEKQELKTFLHAGEKYGLFMDDVIFTLLAYTGIRVGELVALKWDDIDFDKLTIRVNKTYYNESNNTVKYTLVPPKTERSNRKITIGKTVIEKLKEHKKQQEKFISHLGETYKDKGFIFTNVQHYPGYPITTKLVKNRMTRLLIKANLYTKLTPHSLRHTHTSLLAAAGVKLEDIKERLGHFNDEMVRKIYLHVTDPVKRETSDKFDDFIESA